MHQKTTIIATLFAIQLACFATVEAHPTVWEPGMSSSSTSRMKSAGAGTTQPRSYAPVGDIDRYFIVGEGVGEVRNVSAEFVSEVKNALRQIPRPLQQIVFGRGVLIYIYPRVMDRCLSMQRQGSWPKGFPKDCQWWHMPATYRGNAITVGEYVVRDDGRYKRLDDGGSNVRHEFGHALDYALHEFSNTPEFINVYRQDVTKITPEQRAKIGYFLPDRHKNEEREGRHEAFAELFAAHFGRGETSTERKVMEAFPLTLRVIQDKMRDTVNAPSEPQ